MQECGADQELLLHPALMVRLRRSQRADFLPIEARLRERLLSTTGRDALTSALRALRVSVRLNCLELLRAELPHHPQIVSRALQDRDPTVRAWIANEFARGALPLTESRMQSLLIDRSMRVVRIACRMLDPGVAPWHRAMLMALISVDAAFVRNVARYRLSRNESIDFAAIYRDRIQTCHSPSLLAGNIGGLGEIGTAEDFGMLLPYIEHASRRVRTAAAFAVGNLDRNRTAPHLTELLGDSSNRVRRCAVRTLARAESGTWINEVQTLLRSPSQTTCCAAVQVLASRRHWELLGHMLDAIRHESPCVRKVAWDGIRNWCARYAVAGWTKPTHSQREALLRQWPAVANVIEVPETMQACWNTVRYSMDLLQRDPN